MPLSANSATAALSSARTWPGASGHCASMSATTRPNRAAAPTSTSGSRSRMNAFSDAEVPLAHVACDGALHLRRGHGPGAGAAREVDHERRELIARGLGQPPRRGAGARSGGTGSACFLVAPARGHRARGGDQDREQARAHRSADPRSP